MYRATPLRSWTQQVEHEAAPKESTNFIATARQDVIADKIKQQVKNALEAILKIVEEAIDLPIRVATLSGQSRMCPICTMSGITSFSIRPGGSTWRDNWPSSTWLRILESAKPHTPVKWDAWQS